MDVGGKRRAICAPREQLKALQRKLYDNVLVDLPVSECVHSKRGRDVISNATQHLSQRFLVALDVKDCFPSTTVSLVNDALRRVGYDERSAGLLTKLVTYRHSLPQGAPTSPMILNLVFAPIDEELAQLADQYGAAYTRYMDDLYFSANRRLDSLLPAAEAVLTVRGYLANQGKRRSWGPNDPHTVTKIVVTSSLNPNPDYLRDLVRELNRLERDQSVLSVAELIGRISWVARLNPALGAELQSSLRDLIQ